MEFDINNKPATPKWIAAEKQLLTEQLVLAMRTVKGYQRAVWPVSGLLALCFVAFAAYLYQIGTIHPAACVIAVLVYLVVAAGALTGSMKFIGHAAGCAFAEILLFASFAGAAAKLPNGPDVVVDNIWPLILVSIGPVFLCGVLDAFRSIAVMKQARLERELRELEPVDAAKDSVLLLELYQKNEQVARFLNEVADLGRKPTSGELVAAKKAVAAAEEKLGEQEMAARNLAAAETLERLTAARRQDESD